MDDFANVRAMIPFLIPLVLIGLGLMAYALVDLARRDTVKGGRKLPWVMVIVFISLIGPIVYLMIGREQY